MNYVFTVNFFFFFYDTFIKNVKIRKIHEHRLTMTLVGVGMDITDIKKKKLVWENLKIKRFNKYSFIKE